MMPRHFLDVDDLAPDELSAVLELAADDYPPHVIKGRGVALVFQKPSSRTRNSAEVAVFQLGGHPVSLRDEEIGLGTRETVEDVTLTLAQYHCAMGARVFEHRTLQRMAAVSPVPVINLLSDRSHPLQAVADVLTLSNHWGGTVKGRKVAWVGDGNNVARSLLLACAALGAHVSLAVPPGHGLDEVTLDAARYHGVNVHQGRSPEEAVEGADAVCTDVWVSMGQEDQAVQRRDAFAPYQVNKALMGLAGPGAVFLHCLPAHRGEEVAADVIDGPSSLVWPQAANRLRAMRGLLLWLMGGGL